MENSQVFSGSLSENPEGEIRISPMTAHDSGFSTAYSPNLAEVPGSDHDDTSSSCRFFGSPIASDTNIWTRYSYSDKKVILRSSSVHITGSTEINEEKRLERLANAVREILDCVGEDQHREGLLDTPERCAKAMLFFTKGYKADISEIVEGAVFHERFNSQMVTVKDIEISSLCEHHLLPFTGKVCN